jgi:hypothetical protein
MPSKASKLLERMRRSKSGWKRSDLEKLYTGFGFIITDGAKHDIVKHPDFPELRSTLPRHNLVNKAYVQQAIDLIDKLKELQDLGSGDEDSE